jgi:hypothetical protein
MTGQPDVPIVESNDSEALLDELLTKADLEVDALAAEAVHQ